MIKIQGSCRHTYQYYDGDERRGKSYNEDGLVGQLPAINKIKNSKTEITKEKGKKKLKEHTEKKRKNKKRKKKIYMKKDI